MRWLSIAGCATALAAIVAFSWHSYAADLSQHGPSTKQLLRPIPAMVASSHPVSQLNTFEIAPYERDNQKVDRDNLDLGLALERIPDWRSKIDQPDKNTTVLRRDCDQHESYCDVITLEETGAGKNTMTLEIYVYTTPEAHRAFHTGKLDINGKTEQCNKQSMGEELCRKLLMKDIVNMLAGLDKLHPSPNGGK